MKKIPSIFMRDFKGDPSRVTREQNPECAWVFAGEGVATRKYDGTACMVRAGILYKRYDAKKGKHRRPTAHTNWSARRSTRRTDSPP